MDDSENSKVSRNPHDAFKEYVGTHKVSIGIIFVFTLILSTQRIAIPHMYGKIVSTLQNGDLKESGRMFWILNGMWLFFQIILGIASWIEADAMPEMHNHLRQWLFRVTTESGISQLDVGGLLNKLMRFPTAMSDYYDIIRDFVLQNCVSVIITSVYLFQIHPTLSGIFVGSLILGVIVGYLFNRNCSQTSADSEVVLDKSNDTMEDVLSNIAAVQGANSNKKETRFIRDTFNKVRTAQRLAGRCQLPYRTAFVLLASGALILINMESLRLMKNKSIDLAMSVSVFIVSYSSLSIIMNSYSTVRDLLSTVGRLKLIKDYLGGLPDAPVPKDDVTYSSPPEIVIGKVVSEWGFKKELGFRIRSKSRLLIKGSIGTGKSSIARALAGIVPNTEGSILVNGEKADASILRKLVYYVPQTPPLFKRSLRENLLYGNENQDVHVAIDILRKARLGTIADRFANNLERNAGRGGSNMSGGERQMVWLVRAALSRHQVVILDEPTASLDPTSRKNVEALIRFISQNKTMIIISHEESLLSGWFTQELSL